MATSVSIAAAAAAAAAAAQTPDILPRPLPPASSELAGRLVRGRVVDAQGAAVEGASLWVHGRGFREAWPWYWRGQARVAGLSGADGLFELRADPVERVQTRLSGRAASRLVAVGSSAETLELSLRGPGARLTGQVFAAGQPLAGARLDLRRPRSVLSDDEHACRRWQSAPDGSFELDDLAPGSVTLFASATGYGPQSVTGELRPGETLDLALHLHPGASLWGQVVDAAGQAVVAAELSAPDRRPPLACVTDGRGEFALNGLAPGSLRMEVRAAGFAAERLELTLGPGANGPHQIVLVALSRLAGKVVDADGAPLAGVHVQAHVLEGEFLSRPGVTAQDGAFELRVPQASVCRLVLKEAGQWISIEAHGLGELRAPRSDILVVLGPLQRASSYVEGCVVSAGKPVAGVGFQVGDGLRLGTAGVNTQGTFHTDDSGRFRIGPLPPREYTLYVRPINAALPAFAHGPFDLLAGETRDLGDLVFPDHGSLRLELSLADGSPPSGRLWLQLTEAKGEQQIHVVGANGKLRLGLLPGTYRGVIYGAGVRSLKRTLTLVSGDVLSWQGTLLVAIRQPIDLTPPAGEIAGTVVLWSADRSEVLREEMGPADSNYVRFPALVAGPHRARYDCGSTSYVAEFQRQAAGATEEPLRLVWRRVN